jgi:dienelactone hydrolase
MGMGVTADQIETSHIAYGYGQMLDLVAPIGRGVTGLVLLWHGRGPNERDVLEPLSRQIVRAGLAVMVPDWQSDADDGGRAHLLSSLSFARAHVHEWTGTSGIVLAGWSLGASAGADITLHPECVGGWRPAGFVGIAGGYLASPIRQRPVLDDISADHAVPCVIVHGTDDEGVPVERSRTAYRLLAASGWPVELREIETNHAGIVGARYDPARGRCVPSSDREPVRTTEQIARLVAALGDAG